MKTYLAFIIFLYGEILGKRYADRNNIIWILGGDRPTRVQTLVHWQGERPGAVNYGCESRIPDT